MAFTYNGSLYNGSPLVMDGTVAALDSMNLNNLVMLGPVSGLDGYWESTLIPGIMNSFEMIRVGINGNYEAVQSTLKAAFQTGLAQGGLGDVFPRLVYGSKDITMTVFQNGRLLHRVALPESVAIEMAKYLNIHWPHGISVRFMTEEPGHQPPSASEKAGEDSWLEQVASWIFSILDVVFDVPDDFTE